jgi:hypothetical protein
MAELVVLCPSCTREARFQDLVPFRAECEKCAADLHVCITCRFYDRYVENECREPTADPVSVKDRRNLCELWKPKGAVAAEDDAQAIAKAKLAALFGGKPAAGGPTLPPLPSSSSSSSSVDDAKAKLEALFKKKKD